jgi:parallel beta-helix repeat protein
LLAAALVWPCALKAQSIVNGDFETGADDFVAIPGYLNDGSNPSAIPGWIGESGINPIVTGEAPFMDNGHNSTHAAFLQGWANLQQAIPGLVPGDQYVLSLDYNARDCCGDLPLASVLINGSEVWTSGGPVSPVGGNNPWQDVQIPFTAPPGVFTSDTLFIEAEDFDFDHSVTANQGEGIRLYGGPTQNTVQNNTVTGNAVGIRLFTAEQPFGASHNAIMSNTANANGVGISLELDSTENTIQTG